MVTNLKRKDKESWGSLGGRGNGNESEGGIVSKCPVSQERKKIIMEIGGY